MGEVLLQASHLSKHYVSREDAGLLQRRTVEAVRDVSFQVRKGETFGLVGESGCGKSTVARLLMGLEKPSSGRVFAFGQDLSALSPRALRRLRPKFQMVFQDSGSSLNGRKTVSDILRGPMLYHRVRDRHTVEARISELLDMVGLPQSAGNRYPHEFSGGQRQRICIAKALSLEPELIVLDEPVSALDVSVQAQILNLLRDLQEELGLSYLFIGHGLGAVHYISHRIGVMYLGSLVETGPSDAVFQSPAHPYTKALLDASPVADYALRDRPRIVLRGEAASAQQDDCAFRGRCPYAEDACRCAEELRPVAPGRFAVCDRAMALERGETAE